MFSKSLREFILSFLILIPIVVLLQYFILKPHLSYGFADNDWNYLLSYKEFSKLYDNPITHFINVWSNWGVYTYQVYYVGFIEKLFGMNYKAFHIATHIFKIIATLSIYPVIYLITKSKLTAFLTTVLYGVAYSTVGVMITIVTSGLYVAIPVMSLFLIWYWHLINQGRNSIVGIIIAVVLFFLTLLLATERMYPLIPTIILIELFWWFKNNYSKKVLIEIVKRLSGFIAIFFIMFLFNRHDYAGFLGGNTNDTYNKLVLGNWQVLIKPLTSFGSLFLPRDYWKYLGSSPNVDNIFSYLDFFVSGPLFLFVIFAIFFSIFFSKNKRRFILITLVSTFIFSGLVYVLSNHRLTIPIENRMDFDIATVIPALIGGFVISLTIALFKEWLDGRKQDNLIISMVGGVVISLVFIVLTWFAADYVLVFVGIHRYLTIPAIGSSLFIAIFITVVFRKLNINKVSRPISYMILLLLIPLILFNVKVIGDYFHYELSYAGNNVEGHIRMKSKLWSYLNNFSNEEPSIFYFDESADHDNGYFNETTVLAGFNFWMRFRGSEIVDNRLTPALLRSNLICPEPRSMCLNKVKSLVTTKNSEKGILYGNVFYRPENFYAFRFVNKDLVDVKPEIVKAIGLE